MPFQGSLDRLVRAKRGSVGGEGAEQARADAPEESAQPEGAVCLSDAVNEPSIDRLAKLIDFGERPGWSGFVRAEGGRVGGRAGGKTNEPFGLACAT